jgi:hypothetical protein
MNAASATCLAFSRNTFLKMVTLRSLDEDFEPGIKALGISAFLRYILLSCILYCTLFLMIDNFSFFNLPVLLLKIITSMATTFVCIFSVEAFGRK